MNRYDTECGWTVDKLARECEEEDAKIAEQAQEIERLKEQNFDLEDRLIQVRTARERAEAEVERLKGGLDAVEILSTYHRKMREAAERERDEVGKELEEARAACAYYHCPRG